MSLRTDIDNMRNINTHKTTEQLREEYLERHAKAARRVNEHNQAYKHKAARSELIITTAIALAVLCVSVFLILHLKL